MIIPLVAFAAGSLIGSAFFHMLPAALEQITRGSDVWLLVIAGFSTFFALEQLLHGARSADAPLNNKAARKWRAAQRQCSN